MAGKPKSHLSKQHALRSVFGKEDSFSDWLFLDANIQKLGAAVGMKLVSVEREARAGDFHLDLLATNTDTNEAVAIENQIERTNHDHLGKAITYAAAYAAKTVIWVVRAARDEHAEAIHWLEEIAGEDWHFYLVKAIPGTDKEDTAFELIGRPAEIREAKHTPSQKTPGALGQKRDAFWKGYKAFLRDKGSAFANGLSGNTFWYSLHLGSKEKDIELISFVSEGNGTIRCGLAFRNEPAITRHFRAHRAEITKLTGKDAHWETTPTGLRIEFVNEIGDVFDESKRQEEYAWLLAKTELLEQVYRKFARKQWL